MTSGQQGYEERIVPGTPGWSREIAAHFTRYEFASDFARDKSVLDAGCGVGYGSKYLAEKGARKICAVDISEVALAIAQAQFPHPSVSYLQGDCQDLQQLRDPFEVVIAFESLEHVPEPELFVAELARLTEPEGGTFLCSTPNRLHTPVAEGSGSANPFHLREFSPPEFLETLKKSFASVTLFGQHRTAALQGVEEALGVLWHQPFIRLGRFLQQRFGREVQRPVLIPTPADFVITEINADLAWTLLAVCRNPHKR